MYFMTYIILVVVYRRKQFSFSVKLSIWKSLINFEELDVRSQGFY